MKPAPGSGWASTPDSTRVPSGYMTSAWPDFRMSKAVRIAVRSAVWRTTGKAWYERKIQAISPRLKYSDLAMLQVSPRGRNAGTIGGSNVAE